MWLTSAPSRVRRGRAPSRVRRGLRATTYRPTTSARGRRVTIFIEVTASEEMKRRVKTKIKLPTPESFFWNIGAKQQIGGDSVKQRSHKTMHYNLVCSLQWNGVIVTFHRLLAQQELNEKRAQ